MISQLMIALVLFLGFFYLNKLFTIKCLHCKKQTNPGFLCEHCGQDPEKYLRRKNEKHK